MSHWATGLTGAKQKSEAYDNIMATLYKGAKDGTDDKALMFAIRLIIQQTELKLYPIKTSKRRAK